MRRRRHSPHRALSCLALALAGNILGCAGGSQPGVRVSGTRGSDARPVTFVDDRALIASFTKAMTELEESRKAVSASTLREQLVRKSSPVETVSPGTRVMTPGAIYEACRESVVVFGGFYRCKKCTKLHSTMASGFVVAESGVAVTSYHVFANKKPEMFGVRTHSGRVLGVTEVLAASEDDDIAVVKLDGGGLSPLGIVVNEPPGSPVTLISHPNRKFYTVSVGHVARYTTGKRSHKTAKRVIVTAEYSVGSSGAPILNEYGNVVGLVSTTTAIFSKTHIHDEKKDSSKVYPQMIERACSTSEALVRMLK